MSKLHIHLRPARVMLILVLLAVLAWAGLRANAAWHFRAAQTITDGMLEQGRSGQAGIDAAGIEVRLALRNFPNHPVYLDLAGWLQEMEAGQIGVVGQQRRQLLNSAAQYYRSALAVRPLWPYTWARLLAVKDELGELDDEFRLALSRSVETGPWERGVQLQVLNSGLRHWDQLAAQQKNLLRKTVKNALKVQPGQAFSIVRVFARPDLICAEGGHHRQIKQWCAEVLTQESK